MTLLGPEAATCRDYVLPRLKAAGWDAEPHAISEQDTFTDGRIQVVGTSAQRQPKKRTDYLLRYTRDFPLAVVEAKAAYKHPADGLQQGKDYADILGVPFAYATNGHGIIEFDFLTGAERALDAFPTPAELWLRYRETHGLEEAEAAKLLTPFYLIAGKKPRYYQEIAINRVVEAVLKGVPRILLTMATGTGKTITAFHICHNLWEAEWRQPGRHGKPKILYLADRNILVDVPKMREFAPFGTAAHKITRGEIVKSREMYFAIYQQLIHEDGQPGLYQAYAPDFFDLIIVDECHRGSARTDGLWRQILEYFAPATQLGLTATPKREETANTYAYFGEPVYSYSLRQGIEDGFLAPYRVHRVLTTDDAFGYRPAAGERDRYGRLIPDKEYTTPDFGRTISRRARTQAIARHLTAFLKASNRFDKTIVFCVDQEEALEMKMALNNLNTDLTKQYPNYVCRVTSDEDEVGLDHLDEFTDVEKKTPVILTTSQLLTTGVDAPTCKNVVLVRDINSMVEFKQIIGRGTRVYPSRDKLYFNIIDYTNRATRLFADPEFDGEPVEIVDSALAADPGSERQGTDADEGIYTIVDGHDLGVKEGPRKYYADGGIVGIEAELAYELAPDGKRLEVVEYTQYAADAVRSLSLDLTALREQWADPMTRDVVLEELTKRGLDLGYLATTLHQPEADPFDLLCHVAFGLPVRTRRERADRLRQDEAAFFGQYAPEARAILDTLLDKYATHGINQLRVPDALQVPPISERGNLSEISQLFGGGAKLRQAVDQLQALLYAA